MVRLSAAQIGAVAGAAGFRGAGLRDAVAVALAESGGNPVAVGVNSDSYRSRDRGLWQINDHWHPEVSDAAAFNPTSAAAAAYRISSGGRNWGAWSTWHNGSAQAQLGRATLGAAQAQNAGWSNVPLPSPGLPFGGPLGKLGDGLTGGYGGGGMLGGLGGGAGGLTGIFNLGSTAIHAATWISDPHNWLRVAMVAGGAVGILLALDMLGSSGSVGSGVAKLTKQANTAAKGAAEAAALA